MVPNHQPVYIYISYIPSNIPTMVGYKSPSLVPVTTNQNFIEIQGCSPKEVKWQRGCDEQLQPRNHWCNSFQFRFIWFTYHSWCCGMTQGWDSFGPSIDTVGGKTQMDLGTTFPWKRATRLDQGNSLRTVRKLLPRSEPAETPGLSWSSDGECLGYFAVLDSILFHMAEANKLPNQDLLGNSVKTFKRLVKEISTSHNGKRAIWKKRSVVENSGVMHRLIISLSGIIDSCQKRPEKSKYGCPKPLVFPLIIDNQIWMILGYPQFRKPTCGFVSMHVTLL